MSKKDIVVTGVSFEQASRVIKKKDIYELIHGTSEAKFSMGLKKFLFLIVGLFMPIMMFVTYLQGRDNMLVTTFSRTIAIIVSLLFMAEIIYFYFKRNSIFEYFRYKSFIYTSIKTLFLSYACGSIGQVDEGYLSTLLTIGMFIPVCLVLYALVERNMVKKVMNQLLQTNYKVSKILSIFLKLSGVVLVVGLFAVVLYRLNKWWLMGMSFNGDALNINAAVLVIAGVLIMLLIALIPTYGCFRAELYVKTQLIEKYSEEFRGKYGFSEEEWYGEK
ncbi:MULTISPECIES: hypothetical protein [Listeria]|uniref:hypothetical protein n=1 Tax=Listeria TaxID=1637 RepID=UPI000B596219|nr:MULTISPECIES: hypothetical protein [Listeria]